VNNHVFLWSRQVLTHFGSHDQLIIRVIGSSFRLADGVNQSLSNFIGRFRTRRCWKDDRQILLEFNRSLTIIVDPDALMASISARFSELFDTNRLIILRSSPDDVVLNVAFSTGYSADDLDIIRLAQQDRLAKWLLTNDSVFVVEQDSDLFQYFSEPERYMLNHLGIRVCIPLIAMNRLTGVILVSSNHKQLSFKQEDISLLHMLASQASIAFESAYLYQQQRERLSKLYRAERLASAGQLAASVAHEIRNPLSAIRSTVQYLLGEFNEQNSKRHLMEGVIDEVDRISRIVDGLLSLTRHAEFKPERATLAPLIEQSLALVRTQAHNQAVEILWAADYDGCIMADQSQLRQLILNLILNALQAMPSGGNLKIELRRKPEATGLGGVKNWVEITIADTGCGIPEEILDKVFNPFFTTKQGGTGLGLSISFEIARQHGGELEMHSRINEGTTVAIRLPVAG
jgi:two-component system, NtrC family, sensor kinase